MSNKISKEDLRNYLVNYHFLTDNNKLVGKDGVKTVFNRLQSIQYDTLNVVGRNADLVLQSRVSGYTSSVLSDILYNDHTLVDGFDKEMCIYRAEEYPYFSQVRKAHTEAIISMLTHRNQLEALNILDEVREFVRHNGLTSTKDISIGKGCQGSWGHKKLSSATLDYLYNKGELSVSNKIDIQKYFDFTNKVFSDSISYDYEFPNEQDFLDWYVKRRINCVGALWSKKGGAWQGHYLSDNKKRLPTLHDLCEKGEISSIIVENMKEPFYIDTNNLCYLESKKATTISFIAPLDNLLWDRAIVSQVFDFDYSWEVYIPMSKRKFGYYVLPVLYGNRLIARFEPNPTKSDGVFTIKNWWWQPNIDLSVQVLESIEYAFIRFSKYLNAKNSTNNIEVVKKSHSRI